MLETGEDRLDRLVLLHPHRRVLVEPEKRVGHGDGSAAIVADGQIGRLAGKRLLVLAVDPSAIELAFVRSLLGEHRAVVHLLGAEGFSIRGAAAVSQTDPSADAMVGLGRFETLLANRPPGATDGLPAFAFGPPPIENVGNATRAAFQHLSLQLHPDQVTRAEAEQAQARHRMTWIIGAALLIMTICIANAMLMSVTERIREIGTMKCLGALSGFVVRLFLIESALIGVGGATIGAGAGALFALGGYVWLYGLTAVITSVNLGPLLLSAVGCVLVGTLLATAAGIYPARVASKMIPASALASHV